MANNRMLLASAILQLLLASPWRVAAYEPPLARVEPLKPSGIRISVPHEDGITLVAFHVNINEDFYSLEAGMIARDIIKPKNGRWVYMDKTTTLKENDVVYYWVHVVYRGLGYNLLNQEHKVTEFFDYEQKKIEMTMDVRMGECKSSLTKIFDAKGTSYNPCAGDLLLSDDFRGKNRINRTRWNVIERFSGAPDYEFVVYQDAEKVIQADDGLKISPKLLIDEQSDNYIRSGKLELERCTSRVGSSDCVREARGWNILPPVISGRLDTNHSLRFAHGRVELRAKLPRGDWIYPLLMLEPVKSRQDGLQIRIASAPGNAELQTRQGNDIGGHILWGGASSIDPKYPSARIGQQRATKSASELWSANYHTYELTWRPGKVTLKLDGESYDDCNVNLPEDTPFVLTIGLAVGGINEFPDNSRSRDYYKTWRNIEAKALYRFYQTSDNWSKTWQAEANSLEVDYVKVWAL